MSLGPVCFQWCACEDLGDKMDTKGHSEDDPKESIYIKAKSLE